MNENRLKHFCFARFIRKFLYGHIKKVVVDHKANY